MTFDLLQTKKPEGEPCASVLPVRAKTNQREPTLGVRREWQAILVCGRSYLNIIYSIGFVSMYS